MQNIKAIIFDLDGTLLYTIEDLTNSVNYSLQKFGFKARTNVDIEKFVGNGIKKTIERALPKGTDQKIIDDCFDVMVVHYREHSQECTRPYEGTIQLLKELKEKGYLLAIVTNKSQLAANEVVKHYFGDFFDLVIGAVEYRQLKPAADGIIECLKEFNCSKNEVVYLGDSEVDVQTAQNADVKMITVLWGYRTKELLDQYSAQNYVTTPADVEAMLDKL